MQANDRKHILFICDRIPPEHSATGRIAFAVAKKLSNSDTVELLCLSTCGETEESDMLSVHLIPDRYGKYQKLMKPAAGKRKPATWKRVAAKLYYICAKRRGMFEVAAHQNCMFRHAEQLIQTGKIDTLISVSNPFDCHLLAARLKQKYPKVQWYAYMMDSNRNNAVHAGDADSERRILSECRKIFIMPALLRDADFCNDFESKIVVVPLPIIPFNAANNKTQPDKILCTYAGLFYRDIRNPQALLELFLQLPPQFVLRLHSRGCQDVIDTYRDKLKERLEIRGFVAPEELRESFAASNLLINIGNTVTNQVPSKVYESIAVGKPILNLFQTEADISLHDLNRYPICKSVAYGATDEKTISDIVQWAEIHRSDSVSYDEATKNLQEMRLETVADNIRRELSTEEKRW